MNSPHPHACPLTLEGSAEWGKGLGQTDRQTGTSPAASERLAAELEEAATPPQDIPSPAGLSTRLIKLGLLSQALGGPSPSTPDGLYLSI